MIGHIVWINRRSGVVHYHSSCPSLNETWPGMLRKEQFDPSRPRRRCSMCWPEPSETTDPMGVACPRSRALAGRRCGVTERSEGNPRSGLTPQGRAAALAAERAGDA